MRATIKLESLSHGPETAVAQWLRCCTTNRKVAGSIRTPMNIVSFRATATRVNW